MESKNELKKRWDNGDLVKTVIDSLKNGSLLRLNLSTINGRLDLRGFPFPQPDSTEKLHSYEMVYSRIVLKKISLSGIDFSYSNLSYLEFDECSVENCYFEDATMRSLQITASGFSNIIFRNVDFTGSFLNSNIRDNGGFYRNVEFINCNLKSTSFSLPVIQDCVFKNCKIDEVQFDGSRLENVVFIGELRSAWFNGHSIYCNKPVLGILKKFDPKNYPNKMQNVDFSRAELTDVTFSHGVDLSQCIFPVGSQYIYISNQSRIYQELKRQIGVDNEIDEKAKALRLLDNVFFKELKLGQNQNLLNTEYKLWKDDPLSQKIFTLIRELQQNEHNHE